MTDQGRREQWEREHEEDPRNLVVRAMEAEEEYQKTPKPPPDGWRKEFWAAVQAYADCGSIKEAGGYHRNPLRREAVAQISAALRSVGIELSHGK